MHPPSSDPLLYMGAWAEEVEEVEEGEYAARGTPSDRGEGGVRLSLLCELLL